MTFSAISDMHGNLDFQVPKSDILCICGDIVPLYYQSSNIKSSDWFQHVFLRWCQNQPVEEIYVVGGNHDWWLARHDDDQFRDIISGTNIHYLKNETIIYTDKNGKDYVIYGTPYCHQFGHWAFMGYSDEQLEKMFKDTMPDNIDIVLSHDSPYGACDKLLQDVPWNTHEHIGSKGLANAILERKPKVVVCGHLHSCNHNMEKLGDTLVANVSMVDENYDLAYKPFTMDI